MQAITHLLVKKQQHEARPAGARGVAPPPALTDLVVLMWGDGRTTGLSKLVTATCLRLLLLIHIQHRFDEVLCLLCAPVVLV